MIMEVNFIEKFKKIKHFYQVQLKIKWAEAWQNLQNHTYTEKTDQLCSLISLSCPHE